MKGNQPKVILDTNIWISFLISKKLSWLDKLFYQQKIQLLFSHDLLAEFLTVIQKPKLKDLFPPFDVDQLIQLIERYSQLIAIQSNIQACRDPKDNFLLNLAIDGKADYLVTGDLDLLDMQTIGKTEIISLANFKTAISNH